MNSIIDFYLERATDQKERYLTDVLALNQFWLEHDHKYIQWLFPIETQTKFNRHAPILSIRCRSHFSENEKLKENQRKSLNVMIDFFGMQWEGNQIVNKLNLNIKEHIWLKRRGHNHLRISRIIRSLALCDQMELSLTFQSAMIEVALRFREVEDSTIQFWREANHFITPILTISSQDQKIL